ncbi:Ff.00g104920.m01.CDS01 [Fusarium sp. VM40]|nr:Ff.00g104920.m01.CDS01 [Fusarium sp. VM40]
MAQFHHRPTGGDQVLMDERGRRDIIGVAFLATIFLVFWLASILNVALHWDIMRHNPTDEIKAKVPQNIEMKPMKPKGSDDLETGLVKPSGANDIESIESGLMKPKQSEDIVSKPIEV